MPLSRLSRAKKIVVATVVVLLGVVASGWILPHEYTTKQTATLSFVIGENFTKVRKIMVRTDAAKQIVTMGGGSEFVEQSWHGGSADMAEKNLGKALLQNVFSHSPDWQLQLEGLLKVRTLDPYIGEHVVTLEQEVEIVPDYLQSVTDLVQGTDRLLGYAMTTRLEREGNHTRVQLQLSQEINTDAPWFAHAIADRRVLAAAQQTLQNQADAMQQLVVENRNQQWLFPLR